MVRAAEQLEAWRKEGDLPAEARGLITTTELANYCAWFAPSEKVFMNARYNHHREELAEYLEFRKAFGLVKANDAPNLNELDEKLRKLGVEYVAISASGDGIRYATQRAARIMWIDSGTLVAVVSQRPVDDCGLARFAGRREGNFVSLRLDSLALAFGPRAERLPPGRVKPVPPSWVGSRNSFAG